MTRTELIIAQARIRDQQRSKDRLVIGRLILKEPVKPRIGPIRRDSMTNNEAMAYATLAMEKCGVSPLTIGRVLNEMWRCFDLYTEEQAVELAGKTQEKAEQALARDRRYS